jgi:ABC-2 type transport system ATP-binding protein
MTAAIALRDVAHRASKHFEIRDLNMNVPQGSIYGFLGANGAGKTTTIRMIMGLLPAHAGSISVLGEPMPDRAPAILARTGFVPERPHVYQTLSVDEALRLHAAFYRRWDNANAKELQSEFRLRGETKVAKLSKGETGKLLMLLALAQRPELLVLDEPTDGLDPVVRRDVLGAVMDYVAREGATVFVSSHLIHELERICDWVAVMDRGRLVAETPMQTFKNGIKRLRVHGAPALLGEAPFVLVAREAGQGAHETWLVRGWQPPMKQYFEGVGATLREVVDLDLEEGFVELLSAARRSAEKQTRAGAN